ncbi:cell division control protein 14, SIN component-domain-containing protein [Gymnopilus junonius]|uniref:Cell division control protein 14, SIN component-domain-containing protein n=1 Tax=Gymnopilus junonius TaxID=109634 RepID=A0A9P5P2G4_GYMJU|nr:cell division control protein 14, SIN component-domain-containing protein [Gymnopilus junonius]
MALEEVINSMRVGLQASLDDLLSPRSSSQSKHKSLRNIERHLGNAVFDTKNDSEAKDAFLALQYTFECNVPLHLLSWITLSTARLDTLTSKGSVDDVSESEDLAAQVTLALSIIQGIVLNHDASKVYMGRKCALEILLDLLLVSRHITPPSDGSDSTSKSNSLPLTSIVLDTLLCVLVDSSPALRVFEEAHGVQAVVKILKRAGTPREVRMKCLEFLYFYLLDETPTTSSELRVTQPSPPPTRPATPIRPPKPYLNATPLRPSSRYGSSTFSFPSSASSAALSVSSSSASSRSASGSSSSSQSFSSTSSNASSSTPASPSKESFSTPVPPLPRSASKTVIVGKRFATPSNQQLHPHRTPNSPPFSAGAKPPQLRSMMMLRKEVDYVPQSPKKFGGLSSRPTHRKSTSTPVNLNSRSLLSPTEFSTGEERLSPTKEERSVSSYVLHSSPISKSDSFEQGEAIIQEGKWKTTEQKKELLGTMLGNVDALVEGVRKAGIWGLG